MRRVDFCLLFERAAREIDVATALAYILARRHGLTTEVVQQYHARASIFRRIRPDVVLLDIGLPKVNGYDVARKIRESDPQRRIVLVAVTGWGQDEDRRRSQQAGFDHHLVKPVDLAWLERIFELVAPTVPDVAARR